MTNRARRENYGLLCWVARRFEEAWDFVDKRQIIRRCAFLWMLWLTGVLVKWTMDYAWHSNQDGLHIAAVIAAVWTPWTALQGAIFKFYDQAQRYKNNGESPQT